jgi:hypothetical protein
MKASKLTVYVLSTLLLTMPVLAGGEVDRLLESYGKIETVTCQIRRTKEGKLGKMKFLSRVYYTNQNKIHAEGIAPVKRRTIADGKTLYQYAEGDPKGFSRPIENLSEQMQISLFMVPGSPMDHLLRLKEFKEQELEPQNGLRRVGIDAGSRYVILELDANGRLAGVEYYDSAALSAKTADYTYSKFMEAVPGTWIPLHHSAELNNGAQNFKEAVHVDRFIANKPVAESLFIPSSFFDKAIDFVDDFAKIYPE